MKFPTYPFTEGQLAEIPMLGEAAWRILLYLIANAKNTKTEGEVGQAGTVAVGRTKLAQETNLAVLTVREAIRRLEAIGAISVHSNRGRVATFTVHPRWISTVDEAPLKRRGVAWLQGETEPGGPTRHVEPPEDGGPTHHVHPDSHREPGGPSRHADLELGGSTRHVDPTPKENPSLARARSDHEDTVSAVRDPEEEHAKAFAVGGTGVESPSVADTVARKVPGARAPDTTQEPLHRSTRANWDHEGKPTEAHWRSLEELTWRTYGVDIDRSALDWYDMNAWRARMSALTQEQVS